MCLTPSSSQQKREREKEKEKGIESLAATVPLRREPCGFQRGGGEGMSA